MQEWICYLIIIEFKISKEKLIVLLFNNIIADVRQITVTQRLDQTNTALIVWVLVLSLA